MMDPNALSFNNDVVVHPNGDNVNAAAAATTTTPWLYVVDDDQYCTSTPMVTWGQEAGFSRPTWEHEQEGFCHENVNDLSNTLSNGFVDYCPLQPIIQNGTAHFKIDDEDFENICWDLSVWDLESPPPPPPPSFPGNGHYLGDESEGGGGGGGGKSLITSESSNNNKYYCYGQRDVCDAKYDGDGDDDDEGMAMMMMVAMAKRNRVVNSCKPATLEFDEIQKYFDMPITRAAKELKVGLTALKKRCRELNISRWPHRKIKSLRSLIHNAKELGMTKEIEMLEEHKRMVECIPEMELTERTKKLRQACFKANYKKRRTTAQYLNTSD